MSSFITALWGHLGLSAEEKKRTREIHEIALKQRTEADVIRARTQEVQRKNGFGMKTRMAMGGKPDEN